MEIKVLGTGCSKCKSLEQATLQAISELGINARVEKVEDIQKIMSFNVMRTPALVIDGKVVISGQVPNMADLIVLINKNL